MGRMEKVSRRFCLVGYPHRQADVCQSRAVSEEETYQSNRLDGSQLNVSQEKHFSLATTAPAIALSFYSLCTRSLVCPDE